MVDYHRSVSVESTASDDVNSTKESLKYLGSKQRLLEQWKNPDTLPKIFVTLLIVLAVVGSLAAIIYFSIRTVAIQSYVYNGSFIISHGETFTEELYNRESLAFIKKAHVYENWLQKIFEKGYWGIDQTRVLCFGKGNYRVHFLIMLDKKKSLEDVSAEYFTKVFLDEVNIANNSLISDLVIDSKSIRIGASGGNTSECDVEEQAINVIQENITSLPPPISLTSTGLKSVEVTLTTSQTIPTFISSNESTTTSTFVPGSEIKETTSVNQENSTQAHSSQLSTETPSTSHSVEEGLSSSWTTSSNETTKPNSEITGLTTAPNTDVTRSNIDRVTVSLNITTKEN